MFIITNVPADDAPRALLTAKLRCIGGGNDANRKLVYWKMENRTLSMSFVIGKEKLFTMTLVPGNLVRCFDMPEGRGEGKEGGGGGCEPLTS